jgi:hypothetical protein
VLAANVAPELYGDLLNMVLNAIEDAPDDETQAYWEAVYAALTQELRQAPSPGARAWSHREPAARPADRYSSYSIKCST